MIDEWNKFFKTYLKQHGYDSSTAKPGTYRKLQKQASNTFKKHKMHGGEGSEPQAMIADEKQHLNLMLSSNTSEPAYRAMELIKTLQTKLESVEQGQQCDLLITIGGGPDMSNFRWPPFFKLEEPKFNDHDLFVVNVSTGDNDMPTECVGSTPSHGRCKYIGLHAGIPTSPARLVRALTRIPIDLAPRSQDDIMKQAVRSPLKKTDIYSDNMTKAYKILAWCNEHLDRALLVSQFANDYYRQLKDILMQWPGTVCFASFVVFRNHEADWGHPYANFEELIDLVSFLQKNKKDHQTLMYRVPDWERKYHLYKIAPDDVHKWLNQTYISLNNRNYNTIITAHLPLKLKELLREHDLEFQQSRRLRK